MQVGKDLNLVSGVSEQQIKKAIDNYIGNVNTKNIDRLYDEISVDEIDTIFKSIENLQEIPKVKSSALKDCFDDNDLIISAEQEATQMVKKEVLDRDTEKTESTEKI